MPTGVLLPGALKLLARAHIVRLSAAELGRKLLVDRPGLRVVLVRPADVPAYVDHGAADLGIVGKDMLWEYEGGHYELVDLRFGACQLVLAVPEASKLAGPETWPPLMRVATKYPRTAGSWFEARGQAVEVVSLHGSVELAPQVGLVDAIVDLTASGRTLRENRLRVAGVLGASTARLIANQASLKTRTDAVQAMVARLREAVGRWRLSASTPRPGWTRRGRAGGSTSPGSRRRGRPCRRSARALRPRATPRCASTGCGSTAGRRARRNRSRCRRASWRRPSKRLAVADRAALEFAAATHPRVPRGPGDAAVRPARRA